MKKLVAAGTSGAVRVIVRYEEGAHDRVVAWVKTKGGTFKAELSTSSFRADIQASRILELADSMDVAAISLDPSAKTND